MLIGGHSTLSHIWYYSPLIAPTAPIPPQLEIYTPVFSTALRMNLRKAGDAGFPLRDDIVVGARKGDAEPDSEAIPAEPTGLVGGRQERAFT